MAFITPLPLTNRHSPLTISTTPRHPPRRITSPRMVVVEAASIPDMDKIITAADSSLVVIDYSTSWCGPCKVIAPLFEEMSERYKDVVFVKVMGDATPQTKELMQREGIRAVPAFHFWKDGSRVYEFTGAKSDEIEKAINDYNQ